MSHLNRYTWVPFRGCEVRLMLRPEQLLALHRQGRLRSSFHSHESPHQNVEHVYAGKSSISRGRTHTGWTRSLAGCTTFGASFWSGAQVESMGCGLAWPPARAAGSGSKRAKFSLDSRQQFLAASVPNKVQICGTALVGWSSWGGAMRMRYRCGAPQENQRGGRADPSGGGRVQLHLPQAISRIGPAAETTRRAVRRSLGSRTDLRWAAIYNAIQEPTLCANNMGAHATNAARLEGFGWAGKCRMGDPAPARDCKMRCRASDRRGRELAMPLSGVLYVNQRRLCGTNVRDKRREREGRHGGRTRRGGRPGVASRVFVFFVDNY